MIETRLHARLAPSAASRWMTCPGSVRLCESVVDSGSDDADRGTACHAVLEHCLKTGAEPQPGPVNIGENGRRAVVEVTAEMIGWVGEVLAWVRAYLKAHPGSHLRSEQRFVAGRLFGCPDDLWGTADVMIVNVEEMVICDAKFGYNEVSVVDNPQLILYTLGGAADYGFVHDRYRQVIAQPQCGEPKEHVISRADLEDWQRRYAPKIAATFDPDAPLIPSDVACRWCEAAGICPALQKRTLALAQREFASVEKIPVEDLALLIREADRIRAALKAAEAHGLKLAKMGVPVPGCKVVAGDKRRIWKDEAGATKLMRKLGYDEDDTHPRDMITPAQAEKLVGRATAKKLAPFIEKPKGDPTLVPDDDPREPLASEFQPIESGNATPNSLVDLL